MEKKKYIFETRLDVRDYECDIQGIVNVVARMQLTYKVPFTCDDEIISRMSLKKNGLRWVFSHDLFRASDERLCFHADVDLVTLINGRLGSSKEYDEAFARVL